MTIDGEGRTRQGTKVQVEVTIDLGPGDPAEIVLRMAVARRHDIRVRQEAFTVGDDTLAVAADGAGQCVTFLRTSGAPVQIRYAAEVLLRAAPPIEPLSLADRLEFTTQSRYCPSDLTGGLAGSLFGPVHGAEAIDAVVRWVRNHLTYQFFSSQSTTTAIETLASAAGVCRDFAHLTICLLRSLGVPARYVAVYAPDLEQQDFHAVVEAHDGEQWRLVDPTGLTDTTYAARIASGRDGADTPFLSVLSGFAPIVRMRVDAHPI